jgi:hypothetical protein
MSSRPHRLARPSLGRPALLFLAATAALLAFAEPAGASPESKLTPLLTCVEVSGDGTTVTAHFGYANTWKNSINVPIGNRPGQVNYFSPAPEGRGQPSSFASGTVNDLFTVTFSSATTLTWYLDDVNTGAPNSVTASASDTRCTPVPALGIDSPYPLIALVVVAGVVLARRTPLREAAV